MSLTKAAASKSVSAKDRLLVALDLSDAGRARELASELRGHVGGFKIGLQLFSAAGGAFVRELVESGDRVFLDLKFHDIPNTMAAAAVEAARMGVWMFNVHASAGLEALRMTRGRVDETCQKAGFQPPLIIGVTVLTSSGAEHLASLGITETVEEHVLRLARLTQKAGLDGVVASALEAEAIRREFDRGDLMIVTPGIRPAAATNDDQKRVTTFAAALQSGADHAVVGRPITEAKDPRAAAAAMIAEANGEI